MNIPESLCEELQLLKISVFPLSGKFSLNNQFTHTTSGHEHQFSNSVLLGILGDQILGLVVLPNSAVYFFFGV
jgi:hypothetical protein